jgi:hypothetical protein
MAGVRGDPPDCVYSLAAGPRNVSQYRPTARRVKIRRIYPISILKI